MIEITWKDGYVRYVDLGTGEPIGPVVSASFDVRKLPKDTIPVIARHCDILAQTGSGIVWEKLPGNESVVIPNDAVTLQIYHETDIVEG